MTVGIPKHPFLSHWDYLFGSFSLVSLCVARLFPSSIISSLIVSLDLFLVPYLFGISMISPCGLAEFGGNRSLRFLIGLFAGSIVLHSTLVLLEFYFIPINLQLVDAIVYAVVISAFATDAWTRRNDPAKLLHISLSRHDLNLGLYVLCVLAIGIAAFWVTKIRLSFPMFSFDGAVGYEAVRPVTRLLQFGILDSVQVRTLPVILEAIVSSSSQVGISLLSWSASLSTSIVFSFSIFQMTRKVSRNHSVALISVLFGVFVNSVGIWFDTVSFIFRYSTILVATFPLVIGEAFTTWKDIDLPLRRFRGILPLLIGTSVVIGVFATFEFLRPSVLVSVFTVNDFLKPFVLAPYLAVCTTWIITRKRGRNWTYLAFLLSIFTVYGLSLDILRPAVQVLIPFGLLSIANITFKPSNRLVNQGGALDRLKGMGAVLTRTTWANFIRWTSILLALGIVVELSGALDLHYISPLNQWKISTAYISGSLISSDSLLLLIISLALAVGLIFANEGAKVVFASTYILTLAFIFLPVAEANYFGHNVANIFMGFVLAVGLYDLIDRYVGARHLAP